MHRVRDGFGAAIVVGRSAAAEENGTNLSVVGL